MGVNAESEPNKEIKNNKLRFVLEVISNYYFPLLKALLPVILCFALLKNFTHLVPGMSSDNVVLMGVQFACLMLLLLISLSVALTKDAVFTLTDGLRRIVHSWKASLGAIAIFALTPVVCFYLVHTLLSLLLPERFQIFAGLLHVFLVGVPVMVIYCRYFFALPLILSDGMALGPAFKQARQIIRSQVWIVISLYAVLMFTMMLLSSETRHGEMLIKAHLSLPFDAVILMFLLPAELLLLKGIQTVSK